MKKCMVLFLVCCLLFACCQPAMAEKDIEYKTTVENNQVYIEYFKATTSSLIVPQEINGLPVTGVQFGNLEPNTIVKTVSLPKTLKTIDSQMNYGNRALETIVVDKENPYFCVVDGILYTKDMSKLVQCPAKGITTVVVPNTVKHIGNDGFNECIDLKKVVLPETLETIEDGAFIWSRNLKEVNIPANLTYLGRLAFRDTGIQRITIPQGITNIPEGLFMDCLNLQQVILPQGLIAIGERAFFNCPAMESVLLPSTVETIGEEALGWIDSSFADCLYWHIDENFTLYGKNDVARRYAQESGLRYEDQSFLDDPDFTYEKGDLDGNQVVSAVDALWVLRYAVGKWELTPLQITAGDMNEDTTLNAVDALLILRKAVGK